MTLQPDAGTSRHDITPGQRVTTYATLDGTDRWLNVQHPDGLIAPPIIELHEPLVGPVVFYFAECYRLPIPPAAVAGRDAGGGQDA